VFTVEKSRTELKDRLEKALRRHIPQTPWDKCKRNGLINDYFAGTLEHEGGEKENFQELKEWFATELDYLKAYRREMAQTTTESALDDGEAESVIELESPPSGYVTARASAISESWAMLADARPDVTEFREKLLGGRLLSSEEAEAMVSVPEDGQEELRELGSRLAKDYLGWDEKEAMRYVLTGEAPRLQAIKIHHRGKFPSRYRPFQHSVTLTVLPWVPAKEVERVYRNIQRQLLEETSRETGTRILEVARFYCEQLRTRGPMPSWPAWAERWNETHPDKKFPTWRHFREYLARGAKAALPRYKFPELKSSPEVQAKLDESRDRWIEFLRKPGARLIEITPPNSEDK
jgi:hypothetical protein